MKKNNQLNKVVKKITVFFTLLVWLTLSSCVTFNSEDYFNHRVVDNSVFVQSAEGEVQYTALSDGSIEVHYLNTSTSPLPSFPVLQSLTTKPFEVIDSPQTLKLINGNFSAVIQKKDRSVRFYRDQHLLVKQKNNYNKKNMIGFNFELDTAEKIMGGGERVLGMDRRGHRMPLYNRAHYGYTIESNQMYFSLPYIMSSKKYGILFDNSASGFLDIAKTEKNTLTFESVGGRHSYIIFSGKTYPKLINHYVNVTGKQPLPPRWALGNFSSRFGYKSEQQVRDTVEKFITNDIPLDAIIIDLYWFGKSIKGYMGNLDWDREAFPTPVKMISDLRQKGIKTILVTEPFILSRSQKWQESVEKKILMKDDKGQPKRFDFYFGNTGLIDVFDKKGQDWFSNIYKGLTAQGVAGVWGDLGEPEVHPDDAFHFVSDIQQSIRADVLHNAYGHQWAKMVYQNQLKIQPDTRPFIMMRSGFAGSQRFGMIPWTGDVSRSWDGLKPQVELSLQMGLSGLAYTHSDLGGFAGGDIFDKELYIRWLQYGIFQPVFRPHAQDNIAPEPVFHDQQTKDILRKFIKLRYQLLPYIYTMAYQNSTTGMRVMWPVFFEDTDPSLIDIKDSYFWGDAFLVSPITVANQTTHQIQLPSGVWFDYWNDERFEGGRSIELPVTLDTLPVVIRAGSFIPMVNSINNTEEYSSEKLTIHYYADKSVSQSHGQMFEDDGTSVDTINKKNFELLHFSSMQTSEKLQLEFIRESNNYFNVPKQRELNIIIHNWQSAPERVSFAGKYLSRKDYIYDNELNTLRINAQWDHQPVKLLLEQWLVNK